MCLCVCVFVDIFVVGCWLCRREIDEVAADLFGHAPPEHMQQAYASPLSVHESPSYFGCLCMMKIKAPFLKCVSIFRLLAGLARWKMQVLMWKQEKRWTSFGGAGHAAL